MSLLCPNLSFKKGEKEERESWIGMDGKGRIGARHVKLVHAMQPPVCVFFCGNAWNAYCLCFCFIERWQAAVEGRNSCWCC